MEINASTVSNGGFQCNQHLKDHGSCYADMGYNFRQGHMDKFSTLSQPHSRMEVDKNLCS
ncbi:hypothetical protein BVRB_2g028570 [Beta vulgaris subsp. vulgaris]|nr:hypothetical protein BVRB_2g028570 [Beta vulgaris subsp. vulgaris]